MVTVRTWIDGLTELAATLHDGQDTEIELGVCDGEAVQLLDRADIDVYTRVPDDPTQARGEFVLVRGHLHPGEQRTPDRTLRGVAVDVDQELRKLTADTEAPMTTPTPALRLPLSRYSRATRRPGAGAFEVACQLAGVSGYGELVAVEVRETDEALAGELGITPGDRYVYRRRHMHLSPDGEPDRVVQIQEGHLPLALVEGTPLAGVEKIVDGTYAALDAIGHGPAEIDEEVDAGMATDDEAVVFGLSDVPDVPVLRIKRTTRDQAGQVVELLHVTALGGTGVFVYEGLPVR